MKYTCPKCGKTIEKSVEALIDTNYEVVCPQCLSTLRVVGDTLVADDDSAATDAAATDVTIPPIPERSKRSTPPPVTRKTVPPIPTTAYDEPEVEEVLGPDIEDPLLAMAIEYLGCCRVCTPELLMRRFGIDNYRALQLMRSLERHGIISGYMGGGPRSILIPHVDGVPGSSLEGDAVMGSPTGDTSDTGNTGMTNTSCGCFIVLLIILFIFFLF